jgi:N-acetylglucosamine kinase-like BadF-type ATPase
VLFRSRGRVVRAVHAAPGAAALVARLAPTLAACAEAGEPWAVDLVGEEADALARLVAGHVERHLPSLGAVRVALAGGVWRGGAVRAAFAERVARHLDPVAVEVDPVPVDPLDGAVALAALADAEAADLGY